ncbi:MAG: iron ABC transporter permease [Thermoleophilia bacterium]|nr:iron ABC transporter permease [Thermoleophilia bacterium]
MVGVPTFFLLLFFVYPLLRILWTSLTPGAHLDLAPFAEVFRRPTLRAAAWFTLWQAVISTALTLLAGLPGAYVFARFDFPGRSVLRAVITVPFVLPAVVVGSAFLVLLGPAGPLGVDLRRTVWAILIAHVFYNYAVVLRTVGGLWAHLDPRLEDAARVLGAGRWRIFREVTLPLLRPALAAAASIVFLFTFTSFGVILILGGLRYATLEVEIYRQTTSFLNLPLAGALSVLQLVGVSAILFVYSRYQERRAVEQTLRPARETARRPRTPGEYLLVFGTLGFTGLLLGTPLFVLVERSFRTSAGYGLTFYRALADTQGSALFVPPVVAVRNSLVFALAAMALALVIGLMAATVVAYMRGAVSRWFDVLLMLPLGTSAVTIGLGFILAFDRPIDLRTSPVLIPLAHALVAVPFVVRTAAPVMRSVKGSLREAAAVLGAAPARVWREVDLPLVTRSALVGAGFAFAISLGEFGATAFIARPDTPTLPVAIYRLLGQPGSLNLGRAMAMNTILMVTTALAILLIERFRVVEESEF